jgi:adenosylhomocysteinase
VSLSAQTADNIIAALRQGTVPDAGLEHLTVGLERERAAISEELDAVASGQGRLKLIRGAYGSGKTFLANLTLAEAQQRGFVTARCAISAQVPLHKLEAVYRELMGSLTVRGQHAALKGLLDRWFYRLDEAIIEDQGLGETDPALFEAAKVRLRRDLSAIVALPSAFRQAVVAYYDATRADDFGTANGVLGWLAGQGAIGTEIKRRALLTGQVERTMVPDFLRGVAALAVASGSKGLVVALDELETIQRLTGPNRDTALNNLRQIVDDVQSGSFPYVYFLGTGTEDFFEGPRGVRKLEPLYERIKLVGDPAFSNPRQVQVALRPFDRERLIQVARRVRTVFEDARPELPLDPMRAGDEVIEAIADRVTSKLGGRVSVVPRLFLREWVNQLDLVQQYPDYDPLGRYDFQAGNLTPEEEEAARGGESEFEAAPVV